jgi:chemotaxis protein CheD
MAILAPVREVYLRPGDFCFGEGGLRITTLLGSCISIVLWHPELLHGGMCHYMLPSRVRGALPPNGKYGDEAMALFMQELKKRRTRASEYRVHVYGGGNMFSSQETDRIEIGQQNIEMAYHLLDEQGFKLESVHLGNYGHRKVAFDVWSGEVGLIHVDNRNNFKK